MSVKWNGVELHGKEDYHEYELSVKEDWGVDGANAVAPVVLKHLGIDEAKVSVSRCWCDGWLSQSIWLWSEAKCAWVKRMCSEKNPKWKVTLMLKEVV